MQCAQADVGNHARQPILGIGCYVFPVPWLSRALFSSPVLLLLQPSSFVLFSLSCCALLLLLGLRAAHTIFEPEGGWSPNCPRKPPCCPCAPQKYLKAAQDNLKIPSAILFKLSPACQLPSPGSRPSGSPFTFTFHLHKQKPQSRESASACGGVAALLTCQTAAATGWPPGGGAAPGGLVWAATLLAAAETAANGATKNDSASAGAACAS